MRRLAALSISVGSNQTLKHDAGNMIGRGCGSGVRGNQLLLAQNGKQQSARAASCTMLQPSHGLPISSGLAQLERYPKVGYEI